jgi:hypothetical protein
LWEVSVEDGSRRAGRWRQGQAFRGVLKGEGLVSSMVAVEAFNVVAMGGVVAEDLEAGVFLLMGTSVFVPARMKLRQGGFKARLVETDMGLTS